MKNKNKNKHKYVYKYKLYLFNPLFTQNIFRKKNGAVQYIINLELNAKFNL